MNHELAPALHRVLAGSKLFPYGVNKEAVIVSQLSDYNDALHEATIASARRSGVTGPISGAVALEHGFEFEFEKRVAVIQVRHNILWREQINRQAESKGQQQLPLAENRHAAPQGKLR